MIFELGDIIDWCGARGEVIEIDDYKDNIFPIKVKFYENRYPGTSAYNYFTKDGKCEPWHKESSLKLISKAKKKIKLYAYIIPYNPLDEYAPYHMYFYKNDNLSGMSRVPQFDMEIEE